MPASNSTGFCPRCNQHVLLSRKQFNTYLAIVLFFFTVIGFFIYLAVYYSRKEEFCIHCGTQITFSQGKVQFQPSTPRDISEKKYATTLNYCPLCEETLEVGLRFCPNCGSKIINSQFY